MNPIFSIQNLFMNHISTQYLYSTLVRSDGGRSIKRESQGAEFLLDGFPRSGNTFSAHLVKTNFPGMKFIHHFHNVAALKAARKEGLARFILLRDPKEAIASLLLLHDDLRDKFRFYPTPMRSENFRVDLYLRRYRAFYQNVWKDGAALVIPTFKLFEKPSVLVNKISQVTGKEPAKESEFGRGENYFQRKERQAALRPLSSGVPNREKQTRKDEVIDLMHENRNLPGALDVYRSLLDRAIE